jgi:acetate kinase
MLAAALGGLDAFVFTAGVGENSAIVRERIADRLRWMGISLDATANATVIVTIISLPERRVALYVIPTNEELMIAKHTCSLLAGSPRQ